MANKTFDIAGTVKENSAASDRERIPMTLPTQKLQVPEIPGYFLYWFRGEPGRLSRAMRAGYEFVGYDEVELNNFDLAGDLTGPGQTDMGNRVSVPAQDGASEDGQYLRLYLMKLKQELRDSDVMQYEEKMIDPFVGALKAGMVGAGESGERPGDVALRYRKASKLPDMFTKKSH